jgi:hypothetical protein
MVTKNVAVVFAILLLPDWLLFYRGRRGTFFVRATAGGQFYPLLGRGIAAVVL